MDLCERLSIILVTSPIVSHPATELIDKVIDSFSLVDGLTSCSLTIIADGVNLGKYRPKRGSVTQEMIDNYKLYIQALQDKANNCLNADSIWSRTRVMCMPEHVGFGHAVYHGLRLCQTDHVMVVQHDHPFSLEFR